MNPYDNIRSEIARAGNVKCRKLCREAGLNVNTDEMRQEYISRVTSELDKFKFTFDGNMDFDHNSTSYREIADDIIRRVNKTVFNPIRDVVSKEIDEMIDLLYSRPSPKDYERILNYIKENSIECSM